jgi:uncharacterized lipoprotein YddW (UPF0748 family)
MKFKVAMKQLVLIFVMFLLNVVAMAQTTASFPPKEEFRAAWIATVFQLDWPKNYSTAAQQQSLITMLDNAKANGLNAVLFQIRTECDAFYNSPFEPWSFYLTGQQGKAPDPYWDPLEFAIEEAHKRGLELHAWFNPYRAESITGQHTLDANHIVRKQPEWFLEFPRSPTQDFKMLNPGIPEVREYVTKIVMDVVRRYDIDGVQFDDYFYPYPVSGRLPSGIRTTDDGAHFAADPRGIMDIGTWRRDNVNIFVKMVHDSIKSVKPWVNYGISPFGIWRNGVPAGIIGLDAWRDIYADAPAWTAGRYVDYLAPQLYWNFGGNQDYAKLAPWWGTRANGRHIYIGQAIYRDFPARDIGRQVRLNRELSAVQGSIFFRIEMLQSNFLSYRDTLRTYYYTKPALNPARHWSRPPNSEPGVPAIVQVQPSLTGPVISWYEPQWQSYPNGTQLPNKQYAVYRYKDGDSFNINNSEHLLALVPASKEGFKQLSYNDRTGVQGVKYNYVVTTVDRTGTESAPAPAVGIVFTDLDEVLADVPENYVLKQNYPNPFNPATVIEFSIPVGQHVTLEVINLLGQRVATLLDGPVSSGVHRVEYGAETLSSGVYLYQLKAGNIILTGKMTLIK